MMFMLEILGWICWMIIGIALIVLAGGIVIFAFVFAIAFIKVMIEELIGEPKKNQINHNSISEKKKPYYEDYSVFRQNKKREPRYVRVIYHIIDVFWDERIVNHLPGSSWLCSWILCCYRNCCTPRCWCPIESLLFVKGMSSVLPKESNIQKWFEERYLDERYPSRVRRRKNAKRKMKKLTSTS